MPGRSRVRAFFQWRSQIFWYALAASFLFALPLLKFRLLWWDLPRRELLGLCGLLGAYCLSAVLAMALVRQRNGRAAAEALVLTLAVFGLLCLGLLVTERFVSHPLLLTGFATSALVIPAGVWLRLRFASFLAVCAIIVPVGMAGGPESSSSAGNAQTLNSAFYSLRQVAHTGFIPRPATRGGGLDLIGDRVLLGTGDGKLYLSSSFAHPEQAWQALPTVVPANREEFAAAFGGTAEQPLKSAEWRESGPPRVQTWRFRVADVIARTSSGTLTLFASHHYWHDVRACFVVRVSAIDLDPADIIESARTGRWRTLYETEPCVALMGESRKFGKNPFKGEEIGGRLALLDERHLLLTVGDHGFSGLDSLQMFAQDTQASYGKTIRIDTQSGASEIVSLGHRNPQGLFVTDEGRIWLTEHGSQGGDELNLIKSGANYGWPRVTYGTDYSSFTWPLNGAQGRHADYERPAYAWVPSIGPSNLLEIRSAKAFPVWRGNLIVGSLATQSLYRLVLEGERVVLSEAIPVHKRVRDLLELPDGTLMLWTDDAAIVTIEPFQGASGAALFDASCAGCHQFVDGITHRIGPDLRGIFTRDVAAAQGYEDYSPALRRFGGHWTPERLDRFLRNPHEAVPGTTMAFPGIADAEQRRLLIDYLHSGASKST